MNLKSSLEAIQGWVCGITRGPKVGPTEVVLSIEAGHQIKSLIINVCVCVLKLSNARGAH